MGYLEVYIETLHQLPCIYNTCAACLCLYS